MQINSKVSHAYAWVTFFFSVIYDGTKGYGQRGLLTHAC